MLKSIFLRNYTFFFFTIVIAIVSCNDGNTDKNKLDDSTKISSAKPGGVAAASLTGGFLDTLWVTRATFLALTNAKLVFSFVFGTNDTLTLHGWSIKGGGPTQFDPLPNIKLQKGRPGVLPYGNGTYFGNVLLGTGDVNKIQVKLNAAPSAAYVVFAPQKYGNNIGYKIYLCDYNPSGPAVLKVDALPPTDSGIEANPSPPKNY